MTFFAIPDRPRYNGGELKKKGYWRPMERRMLKYVRERGMIRSGERVLVAVSGGVDSCVLLDCLVRLRRELGCELYVAHMNHMLRGEEADADARFVRELAADHGLPYVEESHDVARFSRQHRIGIEVSGRKLRYEFFLRAARKTGCCAVAVGHHADDQVETVLWRLLRGSGPRGLRGMSPVRPLAERRLIRPLLPFYRAEIEAYARERNLRFRVDATNASWQYTRNRIRHELLPMLSTYNPQIKERIIALAEQIGLEDDLLQQATEAWLKEWFRPGDQPAAPPGGVLPLAPFAELHPALQWRVGKLILEYLLEAADVRRVNVADVQKLAASRPGAVLHLPDGWVARRTADAIRFEKTPPASRTPDYTYPFGEGGTLDIPEADVTLEIERVPFPLAAAARDSRQALFDAAVFPFRNVVVRNRRPGDWMRLAGGGEGTKQTFTKKVKALLNEAHWPHEQRWRTPMLAIGDEVLWIPGLRQSVRFRPAENTKEVWRVVVKERQRGGNHGAGYSEGFADGGSD